MDLVARKLSDAVTPVLSSVASTDLLYVERNGEAYAASAQLVSASSGLARSALVTFVAAGFALADGVTIAADGLLYEFESGATDISDLPGLVPAGDVYVNHWGVQTGLSLSGADSQTNNRPEVQAAVDYCTSHNIGTLHMLTGYVRVNGSIFVDGRLVIEGSGSVSSYIHGTHTTGPVIRFKDGYSGIRRMGVTAGAARRAAAIGNSTFGVQFEDDDQAEATANRMLHCVVDDAYLYGHPDNHVHIVGPAWTGEITNTAFNLSKRHAIHVERGEVSGRSNLITGLISLGTITDCRFANIAGHLIAGGSSTDAYSTPALRLLIKNCEGSGGTDISVMYSDAALYLRGSNHVVEGCGFEHPNANVFFAGRNMHFRNNRILGSGTEEEFDPSSAVDTGTDTITINGHGFRTGYNVVYSNGTGSDIGGLTDGNEYYVINATTNTFQLSATEGGSAINLTSTGTGTDHTLTAAGVGVIVGTYDELPTNGIWIDGVSIINPARALHAIAWVTTPSGEITEPRNIHVSYAESGNFSEVIATDSTMGNGGFNRVAGATINGDRPVLHLSADQTVNNTTTPAQITDLRQRVGANEKLKFELTLEFTGETAADLRVTFSAPGGSTCRYGTPGSIKQGTAGTFIVDGPVASAAVQTFGAGGAAAYRLVTIYGYVDNTGGSDGFLAPNFAQVTADASDLTVYAGFSSLKVMQMH